MYVCEYVYNNDDNDSFYSRRVRLLLSLEYISHLITCWFFFSLLGDDNVCMYHLKQNEDDDGAKEAYKVIMKSIKRIEGKNDTTTPLDRMANLSIDRILFTRKKNREREDENISAMDEQKKTLSRKIDFHWMYTDDLH